jgi:uncharacterized membrane-anchored protein
VKSARTWLAALGLVVVLGAANATIWQRQQVVDHGRRVLLALRPVDPRSMLQGDYMALRYDEAALPPRGSREALPARGVFVVTLDERDVATYSRVDDGAPLAAGEARLKYKQVDRNGGIRLGAESFFFQEGQAELFRNARYGVLHVDTAGNSVLVGLAGEDSQPIRPPEAEAAEPRPMPRAEAQP